MPHEDELDIWPRLARHRPLRAGALSVALHAAAVLLLGLLPWSMPESRDVEPARVTWITAPLLARNTSSPVSPTDAARALETFGPAPPRLPEPVRPRVVEPPPFPAPEVEPEPAPEIAPPAPTEPLDEPAPAPEAPEPETLAPDVDFEAERRRAARDVVEQKAREERPHRFSLEQFDEPTQPEEPGADVDFFDGPSGGGPRLLDPSQARGKAGRWLADVCHSLTGGVSVFGLFGLCATSNARSDLFASIKPNYLKARPECEELEDPGVTAAGIVKKTHDCRLVVDEE